MNNFDVFIALSLLYFAAASFSESARRLAKPQLASSFLLCTHPEFGPVSRRLCERASQSLTPGESRQLIAEIYSAIEPFNVAGLDKPERRNWYPVDADDLLNAAGKLSSTREEVDALLHRCGFYREATANSAATASMRA